MTEAAHIQPTRDTLSEVRRWVDAVDHLASIKSQLNSAECEVTNATNELGRFITPKDAKVGEVFNIWIGDGLLQVTKTRADGNGDYTVSWRTRPSGKSLMRIR